MEMYKSESMYRFLVAFLYMRLAAKKKQKRDASSYNFNHKSFWKSEKRWKNWPVWKHSRRFSFSFQKDVPSRAARSFFCLKVSECGSYAACFFRHFSRHFSAVQLFWKLTARKPWWRHPQPREWFRLENSGKFRGKFGEITWTRETRGSGHRDFRFGRRCFSDIVQLCHFLGIFSEISRNFRGIFLTSYRLEVSWGDISPDKISFLRAFVFGTL